MRVPLVVLTLTDEREGSGHTWTCARVQEAAWPCLCDLGWRWVCYVGIIWMCNGFDTHVLLEYGPNTTV